MERWRSEWSWGGEGCTRASMPGAEQLVQSYEMFSLNLDRLGFKSKLN